eukprot:GHVS01074841.1.p1 GENE.GHVS01074841.1~~GHVS01074841.1.p1  ORF type:complete len:285 (+),score=34.67 GHVS01074841.1:94-948(+)
MGMVGMHSWRFNVPTGFGIHHAAAPNMYRSVVDPEFAAEFYSSEVLDLIKHSTPGTIAAFIAESVQGLGGTIVYPEGYLKQVYEIVREHGGLCIADEVQTGLGRLGSHFWGFQKHGVQPDIVTVAKGIGNGFPLAAVIARGDVMDVIADRLYFNTYGGNPLACVAGKAVLDIIDEESLQANCAHVGGFLKKCLLELKSEHEIIGDVRGDGLMLAVEFVQNKESKVPNAEANLRLLELLRKKRVCVGKGGMHGNVMRVGPPMCITIQDAEFFIEQLSVSLRHIQQ